MRSTAAPHAGLRRLLGGLFLAALLGSPSCVQGPRILIAPGGDEGDAAGGSARANWIRYENWRISSDDAIRKFENPRTSRKSCLVSVNLLQRDFLKLEPQVDPDRRAVFERIRSEYQEVRDLTEREVNRDILSERLRGLARQVRKNFPPN